MIDMRLSIASEALEAAWEAIRAEHKGLPTCVITIGPGDDGRSRAKWGHFAPRRWQVDGDPREDTRHRLHEILIAGESFKRKPAETMGTLLHEAAHCMCEVSKIEDTSRNGRYHNTRFKAMAEKFGLTVQKDKVYGWTITTITSQAVQTYRKAIEAIGAASQMYRSAVLVDDDAKKRPGQVTFRCGCPHSFRVTAPTALLIRARCEDCGELFKPEEK